MKKRKSVNPTTRFCPIEAARLFALQNLSPDALPIALAILGHFGSGAYREGKSLCDSFARPEFGVEEYYSRKQFASFLTHVPFQGSNQLRADAALASFLSAEEACYHANIRLKSEDRSPLVKRVLLAAKEWIRGVLGDELDWDTFQRILSLSHPGSGTAIGTNNRFRCALPYKIAYTDLCCTNTTLPYARLLVESGRWREALLDVNGRSLRYDIAQSNRVVFVPKNATTLRTIAIEPALNVWLQLGVHEFFAERLRALGNSISDQSRNQELARVTSRSSLGNSCATIDLRSASDTLCTSLVEELLPREWFAFLDDLRCKTGVLPDGSSLTYEKFSSMGNGFTFALETLIFYALGEGANIVTGGDTLSVYGDDIIISDCSALLLTEVLQFCGFSVNTEKSFYHGPFRESCGSDYWYGFRVTPYKIRKSVLRHSDLYGLLNSLDRSVFRVGSVSTYALSFFEKGSVLHCFPSEDVTSGLFSTFAYMHGTKRLRWNVPLQRWEAKTLSFKSDRERLPDSVMYSSALLGGRGEHGDLRGLGEYRVRWTPRGLDPAVARFYT